MVDRSELRMGRELTENRQRTDRELIDNGQRSLPILYFAANQGSEAVVSSLW